MKLKQNLQNKNRLSATLKSWLPILQSNISGLEETLGEYTGENPFIDVKSRFVESLSTPKLPKKHFERASKNSIGDKIETLSTASATLHETLLSQITPPLFPTSRSQEVAALIIENLDEEGYYEGDDEILAAQSGTTPHEVERIRQRFAHMDPPGIAAKDVTESFLFQLEGLDVDAELYDLIRLMVSDLEQMLKYKRKPRYSEALKTIQGFRTPPAIEYFEKESEVIPDIFVHEEEGRIDVKLNDKFYPEITIDKSKASEKNDYVRAKIKEAKDLVDALEMRKATLYKIGLMIVEYQYEFFTGGDIMPMKLKDLADEFGHAPSTISRAISNKYLECNRGTVPIKSFFTTAVDEDISNAAIKNFISQLVKNEERQKPLSDVKILSMIEEEFSVKMVRRTITKYRKQLNIASSSERKRLYEFSL